MDEKTKRKYIAYLQYLIRRAHDENRKRIMISVKDLERLYDDIKNMELSN